MSTDWDPTPDYEFYDFDEPEEPDEDPRELCEADVAGKVCLTPLDTGGNCINERHHDREN